MKTTRLPSLLVFAWLFLLGSTRLPGQSFTNGDFSKGGSTWSGSGYRVEDDPGKPGNKVLVVELSKKATSVEFGQAITIKPNSNFTIEFDVKPSADYAGQGFDVALTREGAWGFPAHLPAPPKEGRRMKVNFTSDKTSGRARFSIKLGVFVGKLYFDNFTVNLKP